VIDKCAYDYVINQICYHVNLEVMLLRPLECVTNQSLKSMHRWLLWTPTIGWLNAMKRIQLPFIHHLKEHLSVS